MKLLSGKDESKRCTHMYTLCATTYPNICVEELLIKNKNNKYIKKINEVGREARWGGGDTKQNEDDMEIILQTTLKI